ncbi:hypothetical protein UY3_04605 [Chelonia mydas]|uniref:Uncharacterized protein n=1 Tax=Chelonia mydas TaxID=8469 RepID=M7C1B6_CHEMY|nr:hypothetical protein UY3_04605 [Chelonia mydas]
MDGFPIWLGNYINHNPSAVYTQKIQEKANSNKENQMHEDRFVNSGHLHHAKKSHFRSQKINKEFEYQMIGSLS